MAKSLSDYPWMKIHISKFMLETYGMNNEEIGSHMIKTIHAWTSSDYDNLPNWAKNSADEIFKLSKINSENKKQLQHIVKELNDRKRPLTTVNDGERSPISSPLLSSSLLNSELEEKKERIHSTKFVIPTIEEVKEYIASKQIPINGEKFWYYYESNGWMVGRNKMKSWKAAISTWVRQQQPAITVPTKPKWRMQ